MGLGRKLSIIAWIYVIEGFPMGVHDLWPIYLRRHEVSLAEIGLLGAMRFAWSLKVFWSPLVDRFGELRQWIVSSLLMMTLSTVWIAFGDAGHVSPLLWVAFWLYCLASATQDIAIDAYSIGITDRGEEGPVNSMKATGYRAGMLLATALLLLPRWVGWPATFITAGLLSAVMAASLRALPPNVVEISERRELWPALRRWLGDGNGVAVIAFVMLFRVGDQAMGPMLGTFWVDRGFSDEEIALVSKALGIAAFVLGAIIGGWVVFRIGIRRGLWIFGGLALVSNLGYSAVAALPETGRAGVYAAALIESLCSGLVSASFLSYLMRLCQREHAAVQYALLTAGYALPGALAAGLSGILTEQFGYATYFALTAAMALPAFVLLPRAAQRLTADP